MEKMLTYKFPDGLPQHWLAIKDKLAAAGELKDDVLTIAPSVVVEIVKEYIGYANESGGWAVAFYPGPIYADLAVIEKRCAICADCDKLEGSRCKLCGCSLNPIRRSVNGQCPAKRW